MIRGFDSLTLKLLLQQLAKAMEVVWRNDGLLLHILGPQGCKACILNLRVFIEIGVQCITSFSQ